MAEPVSFWIRAELPSGGFWIHWTGRIWDAHPAYGKQFPDRGAAERELEKAVAALDGPGPRPRAEVATLTAAPAAPGGPA